MGGACNTHGGDANSCKILAKNFIVV